ncbi:MAG TPA: DUF5412 family protein [Blastocatellia bacterium]|nr:DUF5412 family protein [Blastocatellia bacterium]
MLRFLLITCCLVPVGCGIPCHNEIKQELVSPDGRYTATAFIRDCGATTGFSPQVYLRRTGKTLAATGNVFIGNHSNEIMVRWLSANELEIASPGEVVRSMKEFEGVRVTLK